MFEWLIPLLLVALLLIWLLDLPELVGEALVGLVLAAIVGTVKLPDPESHDGRQTSTLTLACGFRQGFAGEIKPDRADLVDGGRIDATQVAGNPDCFLFVGAIQHI